VNKETDQAVAIKVLDKVFLSLIHIFFLNNHILIKEMLRKKNMSTQIKKEISLMRIIKHKHVISIYDVFATATKIFMVLELVEGENIVLFPIFFISATYDLPHITMPPTSWV
jgi:5'-AMP-activated protein kinase catalytic alpha subunit